jgi:hypothetical protein
MVADFGQLTCASAFAYEKLQRTRGASEEAAVHQSTMRISAAEFEARLIEA